MKRKLALILTIISSILFLQARDFIYEGINYEITSIDPSFTVSVSSNENYSGDIIIPTSVVFNDTVFSVTSINSYAFNGSADLISVTIPNSVSSIGVGAFYRCPGLLAIYLEESNPSFVFIDGILYNANKSKIFYCLTNKTEKVDIPETVTTIEIGAFYECIGITSVSIPNSVKSINSDAFYNCISLNTVIIGDSTNTGIQPRISIHSTAFSGCNNLTLLNLNLSIYPFNFRFQNLNSLKTLIIGNSVTTINNLLFSSLTGINKVVLGRSELSPALISVEVDAFDKSEDLDTLILNSNLQIADFVSGDVSPFSNISALYIGDKVTSIGSYAFIASKKLKNISIPNAVTTIGASAFADCISLADITLGSSIMQLGNLVFSGCNSLLNINVSDLSATYSSVDGVLFTKNQLTLIQFPTGRSGAYEIPDLVTTVGNNAFQSSSALQSVVVPQSVVSIQSSAFANCIKLNLVVIGLADSVSSEVVYIASNAFNGCVGLAKLILNKNFSFTSGNNSPFKNLTSVIDVQIGYGIISIPSYAFVGCTGLSSVRFEGGNGSGDNELTISTNSFYGCTSFKTLDLNRNIKIVGYEPTFTYISTLLVGDGVSYIGDQTFRECNYLTSVALPSTVKRIGNAAFTNCQKLMSITFPGVKSIGPFAFYNCIALTSIVIPDEVDTIQTSTFYDCSNLTSLYLGNSVTQIEEHAFFGCSSLEKLEIPNKVKKIGQYAFSGCSDMTSVTFGSSLISIGGYAFYGCNSFENIQFPASLSVIADNAFENCSGLLSLVIPSTVADLGKDAFANCINIATLTIGDSENSGVGLRCSLLSPFKGCNGIKTLILNKNIIDNQYSSPFMSLSSLEDVVIGNKVTRLNTFAFYGCSKLKSVSIPNSVAFISDAAFQGCSSLTQIKLPAYLNYLPNQIFYECVKLESVEIPSSVKSIGSYAFYKCISLTSVTIPGSVEVIGPIAFSGCTAINEIISVSPIPPSVGFSCFVNINTANCELVVPVNSKSAYQNADQWKNFINIVERDSIQLPDTTINNIKTVYVSAGGLLGEVISTELTTIYELKIIGELNYNDFTTIRKMNDLKLLDLSQTVVEYNAIPASAFSGMTNLVSVVLPSSVISVGSRSFEGCSGLINMNFSSGLITIESNAFARCTGLLMVKMPPTLTTIKSSAFYECSRLFEVKLPPSLLTIENDAFAKCTGLRSVNLPNSITFIGDYAFAGCSGLQKIEIPSSMTSLGNSLFINCTSLTSVTLPATLTSIGAEVFVNCRKLSSIYVYAPTPPVITYQMLFTDVNKYTCILYVPAGSLSAYEQAVEWGEFFNIREMTNTDLNLPIVHAINLYPNPVIEGFIIDGLTETGMFTLINMNGDVLLRRQVTDKDYISIHTFPEGIYIAQITTSNFTFERKIIKN